MKWTTAIAMGALALLPAAARAQTDSVYTKTTDGATQVSRMVTTTSTAVGALATIRVEQSRFQLSTNAILNIGTLDPVTDVAGDLRYTAGTGELLYYDGSVWQTLAKTSSTTSGYVLLAPAAAQTWATANVGIFLNENGASTPNLLQLQSTTTDRFVVSNTGAVTTGTWNGTVVGAIYGGTGQNTVTTGDLLYGSAANTWSKLADVAAGSYLRSGGVTTAPLWSTLTLPNAATTGDVLYASGANTIGNLLDVATGNALISGGAGIAPSWGKIGLTTHVTGTLPIAYGGTNATTIGALGSAPYSTGTAYAFTAAGTAGQFLYSNGAAAPTWVGPQTSSTYASTGSITIMPTTGPTYLAGYPTGSITVPANCKVILSADGGVQTTSAAPGGYSNVDVVFVVDGLTQGPGYKRVIATNNGGIVNVIENFSMTATFVLSAGTHTFGIAAAGNNPGGGSNATVGGNSTSVLQSGLTITVAPAQ